MNVFFTDEKLASIIHDKKKLVRKYGSENAKLIIKRLDQLRAIDSLGTAIKMKIGRCHPLSGDLKGKFALDLDHPDRLILKPIFPDDMNLEEVNFNKVIEVIVLEVKDYHGR